MQSLSENAREGDVEAITYIAPVELEVERESYLGTCTLCTGRVTLEEAGRGVCACGAEYRVELITRLTLIKRPR